MKNRNQLSLALLLVMLLSLTACSELRSLITANGSSGMMSDPTVVPNVMEANSVNIVIGDRVLTATLVENSSVDALKEALSAGPITITMRDYGSMEKVGPLGMDLPRNDQQITTESGDIILYQGNAVVIYSAPNTWNFTRLGRIDNVTPEELRGILGDGNVTITLSLPQE